MARGWTAIIIGFARGFFAFIMGMIKGVYVDSVMGIARVA